MVEDRFEPKATFTRRIMQYRYSIPTITNWICTKKNNSWSIMNLVRANIYFLCPKRRLIFLTIGVIVLKTEPSNS